MAVSQAWVRINLLSLQMTNYDPGKKKLIYVVAIVKLHLTLLAHMTHMLSVMIELCTINVFRVWMFVTEISGFKKLCVEEIQDHHLNVLDLYNSKELQKRKIKASEEE